MELPVTPSLGLAGKRALVTGAGRGIGMAAAAALAQAGAHVTLVARTAADIGAVADAIGRQRGAAESMALDVTDLVAFRTAIEAAPPFDIFVNNAGTNRPAPFLDVAVADYDDVFALNVRAAFFAAQSVARRMCAAGRPGSIINVSSQMGHVGGARRTVYCATKWALEGLTRAMAIELGPQRIRVNTICPTFIVTPMTRPFFEDTAFRESVLANIKLGRLGELEDVMGAVVYLASDASALMTGASLMLDGGWTAS